MVAMAARGGYGRTRRQDCRPGNFPGGDGVAQDNDRPGIKPGIEVGDGGNTRRQRGPGVDNTSQQSLFPGQQRVFEFTSVAVGE